MGILNRILPLNDAYMVDKGCCATMDRQLNYICEQHGLRCPDIAIRKNINNEYYLFASNATYGIAYCPWCGKKLSQEVDQVSDTENNADNHE